MVFDALRAETYRLLKNRAQIFWSVLLVPLLFAVGGVGYHILTKTKGDEAAAAAGLPIALPSAAINLADAIQMGADKGANGALLVFMLIAAATVYAGDYRWETWRLISARNDRVSLILGKVGAMKLLAIAAMLVFTLAAFVFFIAQAVIYQRPVTVQMDATDWGKTALVWLLSYVRIIQYGLIALATGVLTRSLLASLFVPWALGFGQSVLGAPPVMMLLGLKPDGWPAQLLLPGLAYDSLKNLVVPGIVQLPMETPPPLWPALIGLALWTLLPLALALVWFQKQDLSKE